LKSLPRQVSISSAEWFVQVEFSGFTDDDVRRVSKRTSAVEVLRENLLKRSQPPTHVQSVNKKRTVAAETISSPTPSDKKTLSPLSPSDSDSSPTHGSLKGNIKVRLLLGRYRLFPTPKERHSKPALSRAIKNTPTAAAVKKGRRKRQRSSSEQSDHSVVSSSGESDVKYSVFSETVPRRGRPPLKPKAEMAPTVRRRGRLPLKPKAEMAPTVQRRGRLPLQPAALVRARARQLVSKACDDLQVEPRASTAVKPWAPFWHGRLQLPTQSSRSSRKITINRRFLDDSYTSIGQPGLQPRETKKSFVSSMATEDHPKQDKSASRVRGVGVFNRPLVARPAVKPLKHLLARNETAVHRPRQTKSALETKEKTGNIDAAAAAADTDAYSLNDKDAPWVQNLNKSVHSNQVKKGSMVNKQCYICHSTYIVHHYFMCRVPCCRNCSRFYKKHSERGTKLDELNCLNQGK